MCHAHDSWLTCTLQPEPKRSSSRLDAQSDILEAVQDDFLVVLITRAGGSCLSCV